MKRLKALILFFCVALSIPLAYFVLHTYRGLEQEEMATLRYFGDTIYDEIERALAVIVQREEARGIDEYNYRIFPPGQTRNAGPGDLSPLSKPTEEGFILGYFQNNPDGTFQTPLVKNTKKIPDDRRHLVEQLKDINAVFNRKRVTGTDRLEIKPVRAAVTTKQTQAKGFADKYLDLDRSQAQKAYLGQKAKRLERITASQALSVAKSEQKKFDRRPRAAASSKGSKESPYVAEERIPEVPALMKRRLAAPSVVAESEDYAQETETSERSDTENYQVEVAPLQALFVSDDQIFIFRRIMVNNQIYRQGFILKIKAFLDHLAQTYFLSQPMAGFTQLRLAVIDQGREAEALQTGAVTKAPRFHLNRMFPSPFGFLKATLTCDQIPRSAGRKTLTLMLVVLAAIVLIGLLAIYQSVRAVVDLSERRSQFVSSVTHELKTPLTNIRMYVEMLEQGVARDREREQEYFRILDSEGSRLSRLINNVLEMSKLEKRQRRIDLQTGTFDEVIEEVRTVMQQKLKQEGFTLNVAHGQVQPFKYDREAMVQVLINLIENSLKFGKGLPEQCITIRTQPTDGWIKVMVSDTGPGIPRHALKKIFDDFYRVDNALTRTTRGTGIGLALVKKLITLMGGRVAAVNNTGPGCTITITLPI